MDTIYMFTFRGPYTPTDRYMRSVVVAKNEDEARSRFRLTQPNAEQVTVTETNAVVLIVDAGH